jgi:uncharacterized membrane protein YgdD (TMEM256/DUF423 family)
MGRILIGIGALSGFFGVVLGAFGAHALKGRLSPDMATIYEVGVKYQMYHALALVLIGILAIGKPNDLLHASGYAMIAGTCIFSGSLYLLALTGDKWLGAITPFGGVAFLIGWVLLAIVAFWL